VLLIVASIRGAETGPIQSTRSFGAAFEAAIGNALTTAERLRRIEQVARPPRSIQQRQTIRKHWVISRSVQALENCSFLTTGTRWNHAKRFNVRAGAVRTKLAA
jgi:hypothetical protein